MLLQLRPDQLFTKVSQRQQVWGKFMELERRAKDPARLMNARGNNLLLQYKGLIRQMIQLSRTIKVRLLGERWLK